MSFFDLNIPYMEKSGLSTVDSGKHRDSRLKTVARAMEIGYTAVAYNHPFRGVLSDADRCKIAPFTSESFLNFVTEGSQVAFTASVALHRGLLGVPRASPFRQYTRITVFVDSVASASAINSGKRLLRSYDLVATRPLNQVAFDQACKVSEVDIISLDFSQKLPFRLKLAMVQAAVKRGVYFEISYSHFIAGGHARLQILSEAKRLIEWTRGKNLIISGSAPSLNEVRGPLDVANLSTVLLGLTMERAKLAISGNARTLVADALRKRDYYFKEAIRIERISPAEKLDSQEDWFNDWTDWDPISSGANDLPSLDDMAKLFSAASKHSKSHNSINFSSSIIGMAPNATLFSCVNKHKLNLADGNNLSIENEQRTSADISLMKDAVATVSKYVPNTVTEDDMNPCLGESGIHVDAIETSLWAEMPISNDSLLSLNASTSSFVNSKDQISMISKDSISTVEEYEGIISSAGEILGYPDKNVAHEKGFSDMNDDHCILRAIKVEGQSIESRHATRCGVAINNLHKSKKQRKRPHHQGYLLRAKNLCKPLLFKKATRLRRMGKFLQS